MSYFSVNDDWKRHEIINDEDRATWMMEKMNRGRRQRERGKKQPELRGHFWIEDEGKIIDFWFDGYTLICDKLKIKKVMYHKPENIATQRRMINAFANDFTPKHKKLLKKYWKTTSNKCDYNVCAYKLRHPSANIIYGEMGFGDEIKFSAFDDKSSGERDYDLGKLLWKQYNNDREKCYEVNEWFIKEGNNSVGSWSSPAPFPENKKKKKKKKRKSQRQRQKENKLKKAKSSSLIHTGTHRREATTNIKIINNQS
tara:strand:- start:4538 stop:5302 length:765 start_codon:yes stop_codon:yes gene_type:complete